MAVIDADYRVLESLEDLLELTDYRGRLFASAKQFLDSAIAEVDCVLSDIGVSDALTSSQQLRVEETRIGSGGHYVGTGASIIICK